MDTAAPREAVPEPVEGAAPGVASLLERVSEDQSHAVLDLGRATESSLRIYSRFARWIRFADLLGDPSWPRTQAVGGLLRSVLPVPERPYDLVFAWDVLDRLFAEDRLRLVDWLASITAPDARLHSVVRGSAESLMMPLRFALVDVDRIRYEPAGTALLTPSGLLPAEVAKLLEPFHVVHAFTLKTGLREYVARREPRVDTEACARPVLQPGRQRS